MSQKSNTKKTQKHPQTVTCAGDTLAPRVFVREVKIQVCLEIAGILSPWIPPRESHGGRPRNSGTAQGIAAYEIPRISLLLRARGRFVPILAVTTLGSTPGNSLAQYPDVIFRCNSTGSTPSSTVAQFSGQCSRQYSGQYSSAMLQRHVHCLVDPHFAKFEGWKKGQDV